MWDASVRPNHCQVRGPRCVCIWWGWQWVSQHLPFGCCFFSRTPKYWCSRLRTWHVEVFFESIEVSTLLLCTTSNNQQWSYSVLSFTLRKRGRGILFQCLSQFGEILTRAWVGRRRRWLVGLVANLVNLPHQFQTSIVASRSSDTRSSRSEAGFCNDACSVPILHKVD